MSEFENRCRTCCWLMMPESQIATSGACWQDDEPVMFTETDGIDLIYTNPECRNGEWSPTWILKPLFEGSKQ